MPKSRKLRPSSTPGRIKTEGCKRSILKNLLVHDHRAYKTQPMLYAKACKETDKLNPVKSNNTLRYEESLT